ncbi:MAG: hypothetical protein M0Z41_14435 [Peptococcaceae bacterium]|nr:hypothetical protein [Peptococcaceae bacterium]
MSEGTTNLWDSWRQYQENLMDTWNSSISALRSGRKEETQGEKGLEMWRQWWKAQEDISKAWEDSIKNFEADKILLNPLADSSKLAIRIYQDWLKSAQKSFSLYTPLVADPATRDILDKMIRSSNMYTNLASLWRDFLDGEAAGNHRKWQQDYHKILNEFLTFGLPAGITDLIKTSGEVALIFQQNIVNLFKPWIGSSPALQEKFLRALGGDRDACLAFLAEWQNIYQQSFGKLVHIPGVGPSGNVPAKMLAGFDSYVQYVSSLNDFLAGIYKTGFDAMEGLSQKMDELRSQGKTPASFKEFYELWWKNNEDTYLQLFKTESFGRMLAEMVDAGARLKKRFDDILANVISLWSVPTQKDMDSVYRSINALKNAHRSDSRKIEELLDRINRMEEKLNGKEVG